MIKIAIIGTGNMGAHHALTFGKIEECTIVAACDIDPDRVTEFAAEHDIPYVFTDVDALLGNSDCDAVVIVTPDALHAPLSLKAIEAGKHVLCEKPLALNYAEAQTMSEAAQVAGVINMVNFSYRRSSALQTARTLIRDGELGRIMHFEASYLQSWLSSRIWGDWRTESMWLWRLSTEHGSQGVLGDIGVHILDLAGFPIGDYRYIQCRLKTFHKAPKDRIGSYKLDANDSFVSTVEMQDGALGTIHASRWATGFKNRLFLSVHGEKGALRLDLDRSYDELDVCLDDDVDTAEWETLTCEPTPNNQQRFIESIKTGINDQPDFARGAAVQKVIDACFESARTGQIVEV